jgi:hypothetical protein
MPIKLASGIGHPHPNQRERKRLMLTGRKDAVTRDSLRNGNEEEERKEDDDARNRNDRESSQRLPRCVRRIIYGLREQFSFATCMIMDDAYSERL